ncbi:hypothetical protein EJ08DRAFT_698077 [Tothia fuscella]|uniref:Uncharacterized protein n=1 Tax=Tothia fuscella TaxID=1048955 RepID=A0A9P4TYF0_9PEZI|nr:hypothetical protein EJ08DRAFT_698077 [Tothia fuscella]
MKNIINFIITSSIFLIGGALGTPQALPKANEYRSGDCSGKMNHEHHGLTVNIVDTDDTSNSVYLAAKQWYGFTGKRAGGTFGEHCTGDNIITMHGECNSLNTPGGRVRCVAW